jgi:tRNA threonylcarbamoyladenosine biosynthesis protein TsaE
MTLELRSASIADTHAVAAAVASLARAGDIIVLAGDMGAGKTAFAQGFGRALGVTGPITSPTFTLVHSYDLESGPHAGKLTLHHADLYRLERTAEVADLALGELAEFRGIVLVEWGDVVDGLFGDHLVVHLEQDDDLDDAEPGDAVDDDADVLSLDGRRRIEIAGVGASWAGRWARLSDDLEPYRC